MGEAADSTHLPLSPGNVEGAVSNAATWHKRKMETCDSSAGYGGPRSRVWNKQNIEGSDLIPPPLPFVFRLKTKEDLQEPGVSC